MSPRALGRRYGHTLSARDVDIRPINRKKKVRSFSAYEDKLGRVHYAVTYDTCGYPSHPITRADYEKYNRERGWTIPRETRPLAYYNERAVALADCPYCDAPKGTACRGSLGYPVKFTHASRRRAACLVARERRTVLR